MPEAPQDDTPLPAMDYLVQACPDCGGKGWRVLSDDGTRPPCATCGGTGLVKVYLGASSGGQAHG